jgi:hypothetical protein
MVLESLTVVVFPCTMLFLAVHIVLQYCQLALIMAFAYVFAVRGFGVAGFWLLQFVMQVFQVVLMNPWRKDSHPMKSDCSRAHVAALSNVVVVGPFEEEHSCRTPSVMPFMMHSMISGGVLIVSNVVL